MILKTGDKGPEVTRLQKALASAGHKLVIDGIYGEKTASAVIAQQRKHGLVVDGIYGPKTALTLQIGADTRQLLTQTDMQQAADRLGVPVAAVMAVSSVESAGTGFDQHGRPRILFERHVFRQRLQKAGLPANELKLLEAKHPGLINKQPGGYQGGSLEWQRLDSAKRIHSAAAQESASWGLYQIMGYHWQHLGYASISEFVEQMRSGESAQLDAFVRFIEADKNLHKALQNQKWADFAKRYNGPAYAQNLYDVRMARAFDQFSQLHPAPEPEAVA
jgi:hypothetical protein